MTAIGAQTTSFSEIVDVCFQACAMLACMTETEARSCHFGYLMYYLRRVPPKSSDARS